MTAGVKFKQDVMKVVAMMVSKKTFQEIKQSGISNSFDYSGSSFVADNASALIDTYEIKTGKKAK